MDFEKEPLRLTAVIQAKAAELTVGRTTDMDKIEGLYDYVATNFRYISLSFGVGRYQPHAAEDVLHNQYGDCKDKHTLLASLLEAEGFHTSSVLINSRRKLDPDIPSPSQFDHVISLVPIGNEEVWMDTTTEVAPFRLLSYSIRKKQALVIPAEGVPHLGRGRLRTRPCRTFSAGTQGQGQPVRQARGACENRSARRHGTVPPRSVPTGAECQVGTTRQGTECDGWPRWRGEQPESRRPCQYERALPL